jgi:hypothetical protein
MPSTRLNALMDFVRETPGTVLFAEGRRRDGRKPRNIYLPKPDWDELGRPASITVTYEVTL